VKLYTEPAQSPAAARTSIRSLADAFGYPNDVKLYTQTDQSPELNVTFLVSSTPYSQDATEQLQKNSVKHTIDGR
jgi:hypothetical protein